MNEDTPLLEKFCRAGDAEAFAELVRRYVHLVWGTAFRVLSDGDLARDIAQIVFADLAKKAKQLPPKTILAGWLHRAAFYEASRARRNNSRRLDREKNAMEIQSLDSSSTDKEQLERLLPVLDQAIGNLPEPDRQALLLRFFRRKSLAEIGAVLGISEDATQKRLARALERLRGYFRKRGVETSTVLLSAALGAAGSQVAPSVLAAAIATGSFAAATAVASLGTTPFLSLPSALTVMKSPFVVTALVAITAGAPLWLQQQHLAPAREENHLLAAQAAELPRWRELNAQLDLQEQLNDELASLQNDHNELVRLQGEAAALNAEQLREKLAWNKRLQAARASLAAAQSATDRIEETIKFEAVRAKRINDLKQLGMAARIFAKDNQEKFPATFNEITNILPQADQFAELYEYVQHGRPISESEPQMLIFREKQPRRRPDGKWARGYALADGSVQERTSDTANFDDWEKPFIAPPPNATPQAAKK